MKKILSVGAITVGLIIILTALMLKSIGVVFAPEYLDLPAFEFMSVAGIIAFGIILISAGIYDYIKSEKQQKMEKAIEIRDEGGKVTDGKKTSLEDNAINVLNIRYAKGEINKEEYEEMKKAIKDE